MEEKNELVEQGTITTPQIETPVIEIPIQEAPISVQPKKKPHRGRPISKARQRAIERIAKSEGRTITPTQEVPKKVEIKPVSPSRKKRIPFGVPKQRLTNPGDPNFHYRVFNDNWMKEPGRLQRAKDAGYEVVEGYDPITVGTNEGGTEIKGVLMRIPKELYEEDQKSKQKEVDKVDAEIHRGRFQEKPEDKRYIPKDGIQIESKINP